MANPQKENGYTAIANEILEALALFRMPGECRQIFDHILRKTYGFNKKDDYISHSQFVNATGIKKQNVSRALSKLITNKVVIQSDDKGKTIVMINKDFNQWISFKTSSKVMTGKKNSLSSKVIKRVIQSDDNLSSKVMDTKDKRKYTKDITETLSTKISGSEKKEERKNIINSPWEKEDKLLWRDETIAKGRHGKLIIDYFVIKEMKFPTKLSANQAFRRFVKVAKEITDAYPDDKLLIKGLKRLKADHKPEMWTLDTLIKILPTL